MKFRGFYIELSVINISKAILAAMMIGEWFKK
jgi:hypothetical protein